jgi:hypothetical protein
MKTTIVKVRGERIKPNEPEKMDEADFPIQIPSRL